MAETTAQVKAEIEQTRTEMAVTIDEITGRLQRARRRIPFYGPASRQLLMLAGATVLLSGAVVFMAFYARKRL